MNATSQPTSRSASSGMQAYTEALERALGLVVAEARREVAMHRAEGDAVIARLEQRGAELERTVSDRVAAGIAEGLAGIEARLAASVEEMRPDEGPVRELSERAGAIEGRVAELDEALEAATSAFADDEGARAARETAFGEKLSEISAEIERLRDEPAPPDRGAEIDAVAARLAELADKVTELGERPGKEGPPGRLGVCREWADGVHYQGDVVTHGGATWQALRDTGREPPHADWRCLAAAGQDGRTFRVRDTYDEAETYLALDVVAIGGSGFVARHDDPGPCPGDGWQLISGRGKTGMPGKPGDKGDKGDRGAPGEPLVGAVVTDDGVLRLTNGDGSTLQADFYPVLEKVQRA